MKVRPDFFAWSREEQERYGLDVPKAENNALQSALFRELFQVTTVTERELEDAFDDLSDAQKTVFNAAKQPLRGIGEDSFSINDLCAADRPIVEFNTLYDFDSACHAAEEEAMLKEFPGYEQQAYRTRLHAVWVRLFMGEIFTYASLYGAAAALLDTITDTADALIDELIPHTYTFGKDHGKKEGRGRYRWEMYVQANGKEEILEKLRDRRYRYEKDRFQALLESWDRTALHGVYIIDRSQPDEPHRDFVFTDKSALKDVRFRSFLSDCRSLERPADEFLQHEQEERALVTAFLTEEYENLLKTVP